MSDHDPHLGVVLEVSSLTIEQFAGACSAELTWVVQHVNEGLFPSLSGPAGEWRFSAADLRRARRMRQVERDFDAVPELAALFADLLEQVDEMRARLHSGRG